MVQQFIVQLKSVRSKFVQGLFKGSTKALETLGPTKPVPAERPRTLRKLKHVYDHPNGGVGGCAGMAKSEDCDPVHRKPQLRAANSSSSSTSSSAGDKDKVPCILSPFDEQEEWAKIQEIMASFGTGIVRESVFVSELEKEFQTRLMSFSQAQAKAMAASSTVESWLAKLEMSDYESLFMSNGFDDLEFLNGVLEDNDLKEMGISSERERQRILEASKQLPLKAHDQAVCNNNNVDDAVDTVDNWLRRIRLDCYSETFSKHLYHDMDRIRRIWDVELSAVLEIEKVGHRKRILASVSSGKSITPGPKLEDINADLNMLNTNIQQLKEEIRSSPSTAPASAGSGIGPGAGTGTGTLRHRHKKSRPAPPPPIAVPKTNNELEIRAPSELLDGVGAPTKAQWRHKPLALITGSMQYLANYLGSTLVKELRGTESTKKSIQKLRKTSTNVKPTPEIILSISYRGVKFLNTITKKLVCEHEIQNISCARQYEDDLTHFAYITKDHATNSHYCHAFCTQSTELATEVMMTVGQAFEVAYQMALREQVGLRSKKSQASNHPARSPGSVSSKSKDCGKESPPSSRARSHSASDIKLNGHQLKATPLSLSSEPFSGDHATLRTPTKHGVTSDDGKG